MSPTLNNAIAVLQSKDRTEYFYFYFVYPVKGVLDWNNAFRTNPHIFSLTIGQKTSKDGLDTPSSVYLGKMDNTIRIYTKTVSQQKLDSRPEM